MSLFVNQIPFKKAYIKLDKKIKTGVNPLFFFFFFQTFLQHTSYKMAGEFFNSCTYLLLGRGYTRR